MQIIRKRNERSMLPTLYVEGAVLENVENIKNLGISITNDLKWNTHVSNICTKANMTLGFLRRNLSACPQDVKESAYKGLVCPVLEYGIFSLGPPGILAVCFLWLSLPSDYRVTDEALLAETT